jgi:O-succinylhomoserine sulfhydrylase
VALPEDVRLDTLAVREGLPRSAWGENSEALFLTSSFVQPDAETSARRFAGTEEGFTYTRTSNPTVASFEQRLAALEGTEAAIGAASGMGAILMMCMGLLKAGDHVVCSRSVFGSTLNLIGREFGKFGVETTFVSQTDVAQWKAAIKPNARDIRELADLAHGAGALLAVDNCFCSPALQRPTEFGADLVIHSGTKYLEGQGRVLAGAICGPQKLIDVFATVVRTAGMALSPFNAWIVLKGLETLGIRMQAHCAGGLALAQWLETQPRVKRVYYPGLASHPQHELAMRQQAGQGGAVVSFDVFGDTPETARANAFHVIDSTRVLSITANLGDTKTTITHPATTSHGRLSEEQRQAAGIGQGLIRVAVGLDHIDDIRADLSRGLDTLPT